MPWRARVVLSALLLASLAGLFLLAWSMLEDTDSDVYLAALGSYTRSAVVLASRPSICHFETQNDPGLDNDLFESFLSANESGARPIPLDGLRERFAIADGSELARYTDAGVSSRTLIPGRRSITYLSRIGYNADRSESLFCVEMAGLEGNLLQMRRQDGVWRLVRVIRAWTS